MINSPVNSVIVYKIGLTYKHVFVKKLHALNAKPLVFEPARLSGGSRFNTGNRSIPGKRRSGKSWRHADSKTYQKDLARDLSSAALSQAVLQDALRGDRQHEARHWL